MRSITLASNTFLDRFVLNAEFCKKARISRNAFKFWKGVSAATYHGSRTIFLDKNSILEKHSYAVNLCHDLSGFVLASAFCAFTGLCSSHLTKSNRSRLYDVLDIKMIEGIKFVNLQKFYDDLGLSYDHHLYIEKCCYFSPEPLERKIKITDTMCVGYY